MLFNYLETANVVEQQRPLGENLFWCRTHSHSVVSVSVCFIKFASTIIFMLMEVFCVFYVIGLTQIFFFCICNRYVQTSIYMWCHLCVMSCCIAFCSLQVYKCCFNLGLLCHPTYLSVRSRDKDKNVQSVLSKFSSHNTSDHNITFYYEKVFNKVVMP